MRCLDAQTGRCVDKQWTGHWSAIDRAFRCSVCGGITLTEESMVARNKPARVVPMKGRR